MGWSGLPRSGRRWGTPIAGHSDFFSAATGCRTSVPPRSARRPDGAPPCPGRQREPRGSGRRLRGTIEGVVSRGVGRHCGPAAGEAFVSGGGWPRRWRERVSPGRTRSQDEEGDRASTATAHTGSGRVEMSELEGARLRRHSRRASRSALGLSHQQQVGDVVDRQHPTSRPRRVDHGRREGRWRAAARAPPESRASAARSGRWVMASATVAGPRLASPRIRLSRVRMPSVRPRLSTTGNSRWSPASSSPPPGQRSVDRDGVNSSPSSARPAAPVPPSAWPPRSTPCPRPGK